MYRFKKEKKTSRLIDLIIGFLRENYHRPFPIQRTILNVHNLWLKFFATVQIEKKNWRYRQSDRTPDVNCTNVNSVGISTKSNKKFTLPSSHRLLYSFHRETVALRTYLPPPPSPLLGRRELVECSIYEKMKKKKKKGKK